MWWNADFESGHDIRLVNDFWNFAQAHFRKLHGREVNHEDAEFFGDYLQAWLLHGDAVEFAGGDFATYLQAVVLIIAEDPGNELHHAFLRHEHGRLNLEGYGRSLHDRSGVAPCIDRHFWNEIVFRRQLGQRPSS